MRVRLSQRPSFPAIQEGAGHKIRRMREGVTKPPPKSGVKNAGKIDQKDLRNMAKQQQQKEDLLQKMKVKNKK